MLGDAASLDELNALLKDFDDEVRNISVRDDNVVKDSFKESQIRHRLSSAQTEEDRVSILRKELKKQVKDINEFPQDKVLAALEDGKKIADSIRFKEGDYQNVSAFKAQSPFHALAAFNIPKDPLTESHGEFFSEQSLNAIKLLQSRQSKIGLFSIKGNYVSNRSLSRTNH